MQKILLSILTISLVAAVGVGATRAYFSDTETSTGNSFTAGTLNLVTTISGTGPDSKVTVNEQGDGLNDSVTFAKLAPGESGDITWSLRNTGNLTGYIDFEKSGATFTTFTSGTADNEPELAASGNTPVTGDLGANLKVWLTHNGSNVLGTSGSYVASSGLEAAFVAQKDMELNPSDVDTYVLHWKIDSTVENIIQGDTMGLDLTFQLGQTTGQ